jgi:hypothetical protein
VLVVEALESDQILLGETRGTGSKLEVYTIGGWEGIVPAIGCQEGLPAAIVRDINCNSSLVVGGAWSSNRVSLAALSQSLELIEEVLLCSRSPGR